MAGEPKSPHEDLIMAVIVIGLVFGISWVIWTTFHVQLTDALRWIRVGELWLVSKFMAIFGQDFFIFEGTKGENYTNRLMQTLIHARAEDISTKHIKIMTDAVMPPLRFLFIIILGIMAIWSLIWGPGSSFHRRMGLEGLMAEQAKMFPIIAPFVKFNPGKLKSRAPGDPVPAKLPLFAEALAPEEWVAFHQIEYKNKKLDYERSYQALYKQLGPRWRGPQHLPLHAKALYAVCALKHVRKRTEADDILNELALSWSPEKGLKISFGLKRKINNVIKNPKTGGELFKSTKKHAYQTTALLRCLARAREEGGVLAPASFVWLRGYDRELWYPLNNLGRKAYHLEAAGAMSHYTNELIAGQKIPTPRFEDVIKNLEGSLSALGARPIPKRKSN